MAKPRMDLPAFVGKLLEEDHGDVLREGVYSLVFLSFFNFRFSLGLSLAFFRCSLFPLSLLPPLSPISIPPCLKMPGPPSFVRPA